MSKPTLVLGATTNQERYAWKAAMMLLDYGHEVYPVGIKKGEVGGRTIERVFPSGPIDTITLYLNPGNQQPWVDLILNSGAKRIIFNPGTENPELMEAATAAGMETLEACTLVLLRTGQY
ncbi:MAG: CoA-binding protein [Bacteroidetes bacterium]|nr:CoA-binding protein [Bacteroidota bacterium]